MEFRPCIDIHDGKVKQIVGSSLSDLEAKDKPETNFVAGSDASYYAEIYRKLGLAGGHIIILNPANSEFYQASLKQAQSALETYPKGLMIGGGINAENASQFLHLGASHVIITSYVFKDGKIDYHNLDKLVNKIGRENIVLDLSCRKKNDRYFIVTDRWQKFTDVEVNTTNLEKLAPYCAEYLVHAVDVEGKSGGIDDELVKILGQYDGIPITYAGGVHDFPDLEKLSKLGKNRLNVTIGSALDLFGGTMKLEEVLSFIDKIDR